MEIDEKLKSLGKPKAESLWSLQDRLLEIEEAINCDETELELLIGEIAGKVDSVKYVIDIFEREAERFKDYRDQMVARAKSLQSAADRIKGYVIKCLDAHHSSFEKGNAWVVKVRENKRIEMQLEKPGPEELFELGMKCPVIKTSFDWDKAKFKELLADPNHEPMLDKYAKVVINKTINFSTVNAAAKKKEIANEQ